MHSFHSIGSFVNFNEVVMYVFDLSRCCVEQDHALDRISQSLQRQKHIGLAIGDELDEQNGFV